MNQKRVLFCNLGMTRYDSVWELQKRLHAFVFESQLPGVFLLNEHEHVYTLGKGGNVDHLLAGSDELERRHIGYYEIDRGGDITYHGPGQIVGYPILNLEHFRKDVHLYLRWLEEVIIRTLGVYGVAGNRSEGETGVWVGNEKIAALGIKVSRWATMHGFAFNVNPDLSYFDRIIPCGIFHKGVTSLSAQLRKEVQVSEVIPAILESFADVFEVEFETVDKNRLRSLTGDGTGSSVSIAQSA